MFPDLNRVCPHYPDFMQSEQNNPEKNLQNSDNRLAWYLADRITYGTSALTDAQLMGIPISERSPRLVIPEGTQIPDFQAYMSFQYLKGLNECTRRFTDVIEGVGETDETLSSNDDELTFKRENMNRDIRITCVPAGSCTGYSLPKLSSDPMNNYSFKTAQIGNQLLYQQVEGSESKPVDDFLTFSDPASLLKHIQDPTQTSTGSNLLLPAAIVVGASLLAVAAYKYFTRSSKND